MPKRCLTSRLCCCLCRGCVNQTILLSKPTLLAFRYNVTDSVRDALETLVKHASSQNRRIRSGNSQELVCLFTINMVPCAQGVICIVATANALHRHLEEALTRTEAVSARSQDKLDSRMDKVQEEMESVRACAVCTHPLTLLL